MSQVEVLKIQQDWSSVNFAKKFGQVLDDLNFFAKYGRKPTRATFFELECKKPIGLFQLTLNKLRFLYNQIAHRLFKNKDVSE